MQKDDRRLTREFLYTLVKLSPTKIHQLSPLLYAEINVGHMTVENSM